MTYSNLCIISPMGLLLLSANDQALLSIKFDVQETFPTETDNSILVETKKQLSQYFSAERRDFDLPLQPQGTRFQMDVWRALQRIGYGQTATYSDIAQKIGNPKAVRAVGGANNKNPIPIIIPCHRIIGKDGTMTGYAGGLDRKKWLLMFEQKTIDNF